MVRIGVVGLAGNWSTDELVDAVEKKTGYSLLIELDKIACDLATGKVWYKETELTALDAIIVKKAGLNYSPQMIDRLEILGFAAQAGVMVFSDPLKIASLLNRASCTLRLKAAGIPMPDTLLTENPKAAVEAIKRYKKAVLKPLFSTKARGMRLVDATKDPEKEVDEFIAEGNSLVYIQKMIDVPGKDMGISFLGGQYLATYARVKGEGSWNTTILAGGRYEAYEPHPDIVNLARKAQAIFGLDFTCVDVTETPDGPVVFEVSAFGGFRGLKEACSINMAERYADYVLHRLKGNQ